MYQIGELVQYGSTGVCRISESQPQTLPNSEEERLYYVLVPLYKACVISVPVDSDKVFMRPIITRDEAEQLIRLIPTLQFPAYHNRAAKELAGHYDTLLKSHNCEDWIQLTMSIYTKKQDQLNKKRRFGSVDERFLKQAEDLLFGEFAAALEIPKEEVQGYIASKVESLKQAG